MNPGNPGGHQVRRNCDWLEGQEVRGGEGGDGNAGIYLFYLDFDCPAGAALLSPHHRDIFLRLNNRCPFPVANPDFILSNFDPASPANHQSCQL